jgi:hypothetical protein
MKLWCSGVLIPFEKVSFLLGVMAAFAIILIDLLSRAGLDKVLALVGRPAMVALWAQLQSVAELVSGVALAGVLQGLTPEGHDERSLLVDPARRTKRSYRSVNRQRSAGPANGFARPSSAPCTDGALSKGSMCSRIGAPLSRVCCHSRWAIITASIPETCHQAGSSPLR